MFLLTIAKRQLLADLLNEIRHRTVSRCESPIGLVVGCTCVYSLTRGIMDLGVHSCPSPRVLATPLMLSTE